MIAELLRHPFGTAAVAESTDRRGDRQPHLTRAGLIAALQPRCEDGVSSEGANARAGHHRAHGGPPRGTDSSWQVPDRTGELLSHSSPGHPRTRADRSGVNATNPVSRSHPGKSLVLIAVL